MTATVAVRERPILFSGPMVRAILDGHKTQTRRVVTPQPPEDCGRGEVGCYHPTVIRRGEEEPGRETFGAWWCEGEFAVRCQYGQPGDRLWVRETHAGDSMCGYVYRADHPNADLAAGELDDGEQSIRYWRPSIHMPRDASRLTLEVTAVRVERMQDISAADILAEGALYAHEQEHGRSVGIADGIFLQHVWRKRWDALNGERGYGWDANPWVWVIEFRRMTTRSGQLQASDSERSLRRPVSDSGDLAAADVEASTE